MNGRPSGLLQAPAFRLCFAGPRLLTAVPAEAQAVPRGDTDTLFGARRPRGRFGASTCRSGAPSPGREAESQACSSPALPAPPPSWACHGCGGGGSLPPGLGALFPEAAARASLEVAHCCSAAVLADALSPPVSGF